MQAFLAIYGFLHSKISGKELTSWEGIKPNTVERFKFNLLKKIRICAL